MTSSIHVRKKILWCFHWTASLQFSYCVKLVEKLEWRSGGVLREVRVFLSKYLLDDTNITNGKIPLSICRLALHAKTIEPFEILHGDSWITLAGHRYDSFHPGKCQFPRENYCCNKHYALHLNTPIGTELAQRTVDVNQLNIKLIWQKYLIMAFSAVILKAGI